MTSGAADLGWMAGEFQETYFFCRASRHDIDIRGFEKLEASTYAGHRWWPAAELAQTTETVVPNRLAALLDDLLAGKWPREPVRLPGTTN